MRAVSLFSGCGGLDLGLERAGFEVVFASDLDSYCAASYELNFPGVPFYEGTAGDLNRELLAQVSKGATLGSIDLLAGGPPCPPFSKSRFYRTDKPRGLEDAVGEETINAYLTVLAAVRPRGFILENVAGLAYKVHESALQLILETAERLGYTIARKVINAADYGVPQMRERFFVVGMLDGEFEFPAPSHAKAPGSTPENAHRLPWATAGEAIGDLDTEENADDTGHFAGGKYHDLLEEIPPGDNYLYLTAKRGHPNPQFEWRKRYWSFLLKLGPDLPSWTIQARRSNNMGPLHWRNRILRIEEVKRLQTFPDDWKLTGTTERQWRQVGNAVPPLLAETLGSALSDQLAGTEAYEPQAA
jgi:DNA (cytosine-5)-methyltransferase 1